jgi:enamine deaminase RidA (YjgF/YER057c/UK114 family)
VEKYVQHFNWNTWKEATNWNTSKPTCIVKVTSYVTAVIRKYSAAEIISPVQFEVDEFHTITLTDLLLAFMPVPTKK